jgi:class 3 adenylate cyclase
VERTRETDDRVVAGLDAVRRHAWPDAYAMLSAADADGGLAPEELEALAKACWWTGRANGAIEARERAYGMYVERGDRRSAAFAALTLRRDYISKLGESVAQGWLNRAESLLEDEPESVSHGYLAIAHGELARSRGELDPALSHVDRAIEIAARFDDHDLRAWAAMRRGVCLVDKGQVEEGWLLMEEVSAAAVGGELGAYTTGATFCNVISLCRDLADYGRASEWAEAATRWCERQEIAGFPGVCRVHRAEIMRLVGAWPEAEAELLRARDELIEFSPAHAGAVFHELGEVRLRMSDLRGAAEAFRQAHEMGEDPQPGRALLLLAEGKVEAAAASIRRSLDDRGWDRLARARLLPAQAMIARAAGDVVTARAAADELAGIAAEFKVAAIRAGAEIVRGIVELMEDDRVDAVRSLRRARQLWREVDAPYETAGASMLLGEAYLADGDAEAASMELESARSTFERLGAVADERRAVELLAGTTPPSGFEREVQTFMFTDIVGSTALIEAIGDDGWQDLRRWHDETLRTCFATHGAREIDHAGDGFFLAFRDPRAAVECAVSIQRKLDEHRREHGFAPRVRIGLHATEATRTGHGFTGRGVHAAARIGAMAEGGVILASEETLLGLNGIEATEAREVTLKGLADPIRVVTVGWRSR